jgi:hypothetical protein
MKFSFVVLSIVILGALGSSFASAPPYPYPWFTEHLQLGSLDLPRGVSVELATPPHSRLSTKSIVVRNSSSINLYVVGTHGIGDPNYEDISVKLAPGVGPLNKIVDGQAYKWNLRFDGSKSSDYFAWKGEDNYKQSDAVWLEINLDNRITSDEGTVLVLKPLNRYGGQRPPDVDIPDPQAALLSIIYGTQELSIPLTISYSLNNDYQPDGFRSLSDLISPQILPYLLIVGIYFLFAGIIWFTIRSERKST